MARVRDWVLNEDTWQGTDLVSGQIPPGPGGMLNASGETIQLPLTLPRVGTTSDAVSLPEITSRMLAVETRGHIHCHLSSPQAAPISDVYGRNWRAFASARITRFPQTAGGVVVDIPGYDNLDLVSGNDQYVWHREKLLVNQASSDWLGTSGSKAPITWSWPVMARYKRTLEELECMMLAIQFQQMLAPADGIWEDVADTVFIRWVAHLRTFVHTGQ